MTQDKLSPKYSGRFTLTAIDCAKIYEETASGGRWDRPELHHLIESLRAGETVGLCRIKEHTLTSMVIAM